jgi:predicted nucleotidyltransferase
MTTDLTRDVLGADVLRRLQAEAARQPYPLVFVTVSGAHLYGFPSPDSDVDLRGVHVLPARRVLGLDGGDETVEVSKVEDGLDFDLVTHDAEKFFRLLLKRNGYVLEQLLSPLVVFSTPEHERLRALAGDCLTRHHAHHYLGFARTQWRLFEKEDPPRVKPLLYLYRVLLTGLHLMETGEVEANLVRLNERYRLPFVPDLVAQKVEGSERERAAGVDVAFHRRHYERLVARLEAARDASALPEGPSARDDLSDLLVELRLTTLSR